MITTLMERIGYDWDREVHIAKNSLLVMKQRTD